MTQSALGQGGIQGGRVTFARLYASLLTDRNSHHTSNGPVRGTARYGSCCRAIREFSDTGAAWRPHISHLPIHHWPTSSRKSTNTRRRSHTFDEYRVFRV